MTTGPTPIAEHIEQERGVAEPISDLVAANDIEMYDHEIPKSMTVEDLQRMARDSRLPQRPPYAPGFHNSVQVAGTSNISDLLKAMSAFTEEQTLFLGVPRTVPAEEFIKSLTRYSHAQKAMIAAHTAYLKSIGVL
jgi:hypothetical protein